MRLAVSNIAWRPADREAAHQLLADLGVDALEIAPGLSFQSDADPFAPSQASLVERRREWDRHGLDVISMQSLLFGRTQARLFGAPAARIAFEEGLHAAVALAGRIGVPVIVLGSPAARRMPDGMTPREAETIAAPILRRLGQACVASRVRLALEPVPARYGADFLNTLAETAAFVRTVDHPGVALNLDIGALHVNGEVAAALDSLPETVDVIAHVHVSEPDLAAAPAHPDRLRPILRALKRSGYDSVISIEMRSTGEEDLERLRTSVANTQAVLASLAPADEPVP